MSKISDEQAGEIRREFFDSTMIWDIAKVSQRYGISEKEVYAAIANPRRVSKSRRELSHRKVKPKPMAEGAIASAIDPAFDLGNQSRGRLAEIAALIWQAGYDDGLSNRPRLPRKMLLAKYGISMSKQYQGVCISHVYSAGFKFGSFDLDAGLRSLRDS